jgi:NhaP-type Na+/H+ or K+/H+ antiporter
VLHPADVLTVVVAWMAVLAVCLAAVLVGQTARTAPRRRRRRRSRAARIGLFLSLSGPWLALLAGAGVGAVTGAWLVVAAATACGIAATALAGLTLRPR